MEIALPGCKSVANEVGVIFTERDGMDSLNSGIV
jgi:hypothetical protein